MTIRKPPEYVVIPVEIVFGHGDLPDYLYRTYTTILALAWYTGYDYCRLTLRELGSVLGCDEKTARRRLWELQGQGLLEWERVTKFELTIRPLVRATSVREAGASVPVVWTSEDEGPVIGDEEGYAQKRSQCESARSHCERFGTVVGGGGESDPRPVSRENHQQHQQQDTMLQQRQGYAKKRSHCERFTDDDLSGEQWSVVAGLTGVGVWIRTAMAWARDYDPAEIEALLKHARAQGDKLRNPGGWIRRQLEGER